jgi:hypothetical protein
MLPQVGNSKLLNLKVKRSRRLRVVPMAIVGIFNSAIIILCADQKSLNEYAEKPPARSARVLAGAACAGLGGGLGGVGAGRSRVTTRRGRGGSQALSSQAAACWFGIAAVTTRLRVGSARSRARQYVGSCKSRLRLVVGRRRGVVRRGVAGRGVVDVRHVDRLDGRRRVVVRERVRHRVRRRVRHRVRRLRVVVREDGRCVVGPEVVGVRRRVRVARQRRGRRRQRLGRRSQRLGRRLR